MILPLGMRLNFILFFLTFHNIQHKGQIRTSSDNIGRAVPSSKNRSLKKQGLGKKNNPSQREKRLWIWQSCITCCHSQALKNKASSHRT
ncbi:hypothetical protein VNO78_30383 [Psophocarpus tetragonolobus]|uniref:Secreted protein n=1 Tax=Psophocarpus tetragonolobus TaxID=3891 RepID=A0AAN9RWT4_PSOTE